MAESKRHVRKLSGAVLMMVVTIMFILIIMLLATLTVVSNVNKRTITKFEENQAYYTARSTVEVFIDEFLEDDKTTTDSTTVKSVWENNGFIFDSGAATLLSNLTGSKDFAGKDATEGFIHQQEIFSRLKPKYRLKTKTSDTGGSVLSAAGTVTGNLKDDTMWTENTDAVNNNKYYVEFDASLPDISNKTTGTNDRVGLINETDSSGKPKPVKVRLELLRVAYRTANDTLLYDGEYYEKGTDANHEADLVESNKVKMSVINWEKTVYRLKVQATSKISSAAGGYSERTVSVILEPGTQPIPAEGGAAVCALAGTKTSNHFFVIGGASSNDRIDEPGVYTYSNECSMVGKQFVYRCDQLHINTTVSPWSFANFIVRDGFISFQNESTPTSLTTITDTHVDEDEPTDPSKVPVDVLNQNGRALMYANGFYSSTKNKIGTSDGKVDLVICAENGYDSTKPANDSGKGRLLKYCEGLGVSPWYTDPYANPLGSNNLTIRGGITDADSYLNQFAFVSGTNGFELYGDLYVDGNILFRNNASPGIVIHGALYCTGDIYVTNDNAGFLKVDDGIYTGDVTDPVNEGQHIFLTNGQLAVNLSSTTGKMPEFGSWRAPVVENTADRTKKYPYMYDCINLSPKDGTYSSIDMRGPTLIATPLAMESVYLYTNQKESMYQEAIRKFKDANPTCNKFGHDCAKDFINSYLDSGGNFFDHGEVSKDPRDPSSGYDIKKVNIETPTITVGDENLYDDDNNILRQKAVFDSQSALAMLRKAANTDDIDLTVSNSSPFWNKANTTLSPSMAPLNNKTDLREIKINLGQFFENNNGEYFIDATEDSYQIELVGECQNWGSPTIKIRVKGDNHVFFTIADNTASSWKELKIGALKVMVVDESSPVNESINMAGKQSGNNFGTFNTGDQVSHIPSTLTPDKEPPVRMYVGRRNKLFMYNANNSYLGMLIMGPDASFYCNAGTYPTVTYTFDGGKSGLSPLTTKNVGVAGRMVFKYIETQNEYGCIFLPPDSSGGSEGGTSSRIVWKRQRYLNG